MTRRATSAVGLRTALAAILVALLALPLAAQDRRGPSEEEIRKVQAAFLYQFYFYMRGLPCQLSNSDYSIGVLGDDPFGEHLDAVEKQRVGDHSVRLYRATDPDSLEQCDLIFISDSERERLDELLTHFRGEQQVLVSDMVGFAERGGTVGFILADGRVGFEINQATATESKIELSSHLLRLAREIWR